MDLINIIYSECEALGAVFGFGAFEGGVIYFSVFSLLLVKIIDAIKNTVKGKEKNIVKGEIDTQELAVKIKVIK